MTETAPGAVTDTASDEGHGQRAVGNGEEGTAPASPPEAVTEPAPEGVTQTAPAPRVRADGFACPRCGGNAPASNGTRMNHRRGVVRRYRQCQSCSHAFVTETCFRGDGTRGPEEVVA
jgi:hypothetical protein